MQLFAVVNRTGGTQNVADRHLAAFARKFIAAARTTNAFENSAADQRLQYWFEVARRQSVMQK